MSNRNRLLMLAVAVIAIAGGAGYFFARSDDRAPADEMALDAYRSGPFMVRVGIEPRAPVAGDNRLVIEVADAQNAPVTDADLQVYGTMPAMGAMAAMRAPAELSEVSPGRYAGTLELPMGGEWPLSVHITKPGAGETELSFDMATGRPGLALASGGTPVRGPDSPAGSQSADAAPPAADPEGFYTAGAYRLKVAIDPGNPRVGDNRVTLRVRGRESELPDDARVRAVAQMPSMKQMPAVKIDDLRLQAPGVYSGTLALSMAGDWVLAVDVQSEALGHGDLVFELTTGKPGIEAAAATPEGVAYYTCPMHPSVKSASEGNCPICGMTLQAVTRSEQQSGTITVDARRRQLIGLTTAPVRRVELEKTIRAVGSVMVDETRLADVSLKFDAWVGPLQADAVGIQVRRGQTLFSVYGPELLAAQDEYLQTRRRSRSPELVRAARQRLALWDIDDAQLRHIERLGKPLQYLPITSPISGTVVTKNVVEGTAVKAGMTLMRIADLSEVWIEADVYENELPLVQAGMPATVTLPYLPGRSWSAKVDYVYPYLTNMTRTGRIRLRLDNPDGELKPDMYAEVRLASDMGRALAVPEQAVLYAGDSRVVFVDLGDGKLQPRRIKAGRRSGEWIEVLDGVEEGESVVTSGNFLIAAETRLKAGIKQW